MLKTAEAVPMTIPLVADSLLSVDTSAGSSPTVRYDAALGLSPDNLNVISAFNGLVSGLTTDDISLSGGIGCQIANVGLGFFIDLLTDQLLDGAQQQFVGLCHRTALRL